MLRSPHAHARIRKLDAARARGIPGVRAVITAADIPGRNLIPMIQSDWPVLAQDSCRHVGEAVALVAADTRGGARRRRWRRSHVEYEPLPALLDMEEALGAGEVMARWKVRRGEAGVAHDPQRRWSWSRAPIARPTRSTRTSRPTA